MRRFIQDNYFWGEEAACGDLIFLEGTKNPVEYHVCHFGPIFALLPPPPPPPPKKEKKPQKIKISKQ